VCVCVSITMDRERAVYYSRTVKRWLSPTRGKRTWWGAEEVGSWTVQR